MSWRCGKCDGADLPKHSRHCPKWVQETTPEEIRWLEQTRHD